MNITEFLLARIAEDEAVADGITAPAAITQSVLPWTPCSLSAWADSGWDEGGIDITPTRVLAECEAKRKIVKRIERARRAAGGITAAHVEIVALLAEVYADHPDYCEEWRP